MPKSLFWRLCFWLFVLLIVFFALFPFGYAILSSLLTGNALYDVTQVVNTGLSFANYSSILDNEDQPFWLNIMNSLLVSVSVVAASLFLGVTAAYALGRVQFRGRGLLLIMVLAVSMFPQVAVLAGMFEMMRAMGLYNKSMGLVLPYLIFTLPFTVWVLTTFIRDLQKEIEEAAMMDGCTPWQIMKDEFL